MVVQCYEKTILCPFEFSPIKGRHFSFRFDVSQKKRRDKKKFSLSSVSCKAIRDCHGDLLRSPGGTAVTQLSTTWQKGIFTFFFYYYYHLPLPFVLMPFHFASKNHSQKSIMYPPSSPVFFLSPFCMHHLTLD